MAKSNRDLIRLVSSAGTGHFYTTSKNKRTKPEKIEFMKYDPVVRKHVIYKPGDRVAVRRKIMKGGGIQAHRRHSNLTTTT